MSYKILLTESIHSAGIEILKKAGEVDIPSDPSEETLIKVINNYDALVVRASRLSANVIDAGKNLKVIGRHGIGTDNIDVDAASRNGIIVVNTPEANSISVAEYTLGAMLYLSKKLKETDRALRNGEFDRPGSLTGLVPKLGYSNFELCGKTVGLIGFGKIARYVAKMCMYGFDMKVIAYDPFLTDDFIKEYGAEPCSTVEEVAANADFLSIHVPLTPDTKDLIDAGIISLMKPAAYIINAARGGIINENDLALALQNKAITGAAIDVFEKEPPNMDHPFFKLDNILVTPHLAAMTDNALYRMAVDVSQGVADVLEGKEPKYFFNKKALQK